MNYRTLWILVFILLPMTLRAAPPPDRLPWQTQTSIQALGSPQAKVGGRVVTVLASFPLTLRQVGPDSSSPFRRLMDENDLSLLVTHPNDDRWLPLLATHWALAADGRTVYYRLNPQACWSDGQPVKASDYVFTLEFMRSPHIQSPWARDYYTKTIDAVETFQEKDGTEVIAVRLVKPDSDRLATTNLKPMPRHFYGVLSADFIHTWNWKVPPNPGPYQITDIEKGQRIVFTRHKNWWARELPLFKNRFNVDEVVFKALADIQVAFAYLKAGDIDIMTITSPDLWHAGERDEPFLKGYLHRLQAYNETPRNDYVLIMNQAREPFQDIRVRKALAHALNVERVIRDLLQGDFQRLQGISQGYGPYTNRRIQARSHDLRKADELLNQAGWQTRNAEGIRTKAGRTLTATIIYSQSNLTPRFLLLQEDARKAGFDLKLQQMDQTLAFKRFRDKQHDVAFWAWTTPYRPEYRSRFHSEFAGKGPNSNFSNTASPEL
ncbi:MAG: ABC transporter substrate-binding protein, partial [Pseudobdellovibrionaceae bacterium]|nr:ABC transporter substrate-binding protein [Pseudobdellovibrionaceae bacterium]